jgi:hypothetical protein
MVVTSLRDTGGKQWKERKAVVSVRDMESQRVALGYPVNMYSEWYLIDAQKGKAVTVQAWAGPHGYSRLRLPYLKAIFT